MLRHFLFCSLAILTFKSAYAQVSSLTIPCQEAARTAETIRNDEIYTKCGFDNRKKALGEWAVWAEAEKSGQALYEICLRHKMETYCQKAVEFGNGPALLRRANKLYTEKKYAEAAALYTRALPSPLLTTVEKGQIAQNMGILYLDKTSTYYNPQKGVPLIEKATQMRGAEANNIMGVYSLFGLNGVKRSPEKSFEYLWRAILLGCPAAEENLGLFHLARQKKIDNQTLYDEMAKRTLSCEAPEFVEPEVLEDQNCNCAEILEREQLIQQNPYQLVQVNENLKQALLKDKDGKEINVEKDSVLPNGAKVNEIRKTVLILTNGRARNILYLAPDASCLELCHKQKASKDPRAKVIRPYKLTFTPSECSNILYYAEFLVDTNLPFTGKTECGFSNDLNKASELLMNL